MIALDAAAAMPHNVRLRQLGCREATGVMANRTPEWGITVIENQLARQHGTDSSWLSITVIQNPSARFPLPALLRGPPHGRKPARVPEQFGGVVGHVAFLERGDVVRRCLTLGFGHGPHR
jgi:hypothetical protein